MVLSRSAFASGALMEQKNEKSQADILLRIRASKSHLLKQRLIQIAGAWGSWSKNSARTD